MVESTLLCWKDLGLSPMYANYVLFDLLLIFNNMHEYIEW